MSKFSQISAKELIKAMEKCDFRFVSQKGSHIKLKKSTGKTKIIIIPNHKIIRPGTLNNILRVAEISKNELEELLK